MRFTPEEREIVLEMAKNCLSKHNLTKKNVFSTLKEYNK